MPCSPWYYPFAVVAVLLATPASADSRGTPDEAKALAERASAHLRDVGLDKACADFSDRNGTYWDRDLWVFVYAPDLTEACVPGAPALLGKDVRTLKDPDGKEFGKAIVETATEHGSGWVEYRFTNPITKKIEPKVTYALKTGDFIVGVGAYRP